VKKADSVEVASLDLKSCEKKFNNIYPQLEVDDHDNPACTVCIISHIALKIPGKLHLNPETKKIREQRFS
jgi:hypothetical protein